MKPQFQHEFSVNNSKLWDKPKIFLVNKFVALALNLKIIA